MSLLVLLLLAAPEPPPVSARLTIRERVIVRVPTRRIALQPRVRWKERRGPKCIAMGQVAGAATSARDSVDLILRGGGRMRAEFAGSCPALDFYSGFYILPTEDRRICADRDAIHARSGGACEIERFRALEAEAPPLPLRPLPPRGLGTVSRERR